MFVSSYNTYISTNSSEKTSKGKLQGAQNTSSYTPKKEEVTSTEPKNKALAIDYVASSKTFNNKLKIELQQRQLQNQSDTQTAKTKDLTSKFTNINSLESAKQAYNDNAKIFSLFKLPQPTLDQTPKIDKRAPSDIQEKNLRDLMVNTYIQNDKYYQITA